MPSWLADLGQSVNRNSFNRQFCDFDPETLSDRIEVITLEDRSGDGGGIECGRWRYPAGQPGEPGPERHTTACNSNQGFQQSRLANADYLFGLAAECALKSVMQALGMGLDASGTPTDKAHKVHIDRLWTEFITFATGRSGAQYVSLLPAGPNPFMNWDVNQRYEHQAQFAQNVVQQHQQGAKNAMAVLQQAKQDGRV